MNRPGRKEQAALDKAPEAFRTISEVADELDLPQHVLRFWETRFTQIKPMKRGGGRRYYRPDDVDLLRGIRHLLYSEGYTIRGVQRILKDNGAKFVQSVWQAGAPQPRKSAADLEGGDEDAASRAGGAAQAARAGMPAARRGSENEAGARAAAGAQPVEAPRSAAAPSPAPATRGPGPSAPAQAAASEPAAGSAGRPAARLTQASIRELEEAFRELAECRRLIDAALSGGS